MTRPAGRVRSARRIGVPIEGGPLPRKGQIILPKALPGPVSVSGGGLPRRQNFRRPEDLVHIALSAVLRLKIRPQQFRQFRRGHPLKVFHGASLLS